MDWTGSTGVINMDTGEPFETDTVGRIASATKPFTSTLILQLVDQGRISLDTTLAEFVPDYPKAQDITVEHLLRHRSQIPEIPLVDGFFIGFVLMFPQVWFTPMDMLDWTTLDLPIFNIHSMEFVPRAPVAEPGGPFHYSQPGYVALGLIIQEITGKSLADVYQERICQPLGMTGTRLAAKDDPLDPPGYTNLFGLLDEKMSSSELVSSGNGMFSASWAAGGMISTAGDLVIFLSAMLEGGLFSEPSLAKATDWMEIEPGDIVSGGEYGLGLFRSQYDGYTGIGHGGAMPGGVSVMSYIPELDVYIGAVSNSDRDDLEALSLRERVRRALLNLDQEDD